MTVARRVWFININLNKAHSFLYCVTYGTSSRRDERRGGARALVSVVEPSVRIADEGAPLLPSSRYEERSQRGARAMEWTVKSGTVVVIAVVASGGQPRARHAGVMFVIIALLNKEKLCHIRVRTAHSSERDDQTARTTMNDDGYDANRRPARCCARTTARRRRTRRRRRTTTRRRATAARPCGRPFRASSRFRGGSTSASECAFPLRFGRRFPPCFSPSTSVRATRRRFRRRFARRRSSSERRQWRGRTEVLRRAPSHPFLQVPSVLTAAPLPSPESREDGVILTQASVRAHTRVGGGRSHRRFLLVVRRYDLKSKYDHGH